MPQFPSLPLWSRPVPEEPAHGLAQRQAAVNGLPSAALAYRQLEISPRGLRRGVGLEALAASVRCHVHAVSSDSFHLDEDGQTTRVRGVALNFKQDVDQMRRRACPGCLRESSHHRFWWDIAAISSCPRHKILLEDRCNCASRTKLSWLDGTLWRCQGCRKLPEAGKGDLRTSVGTPVDPGIGAMDAYLLGRFGVVGKRPIAALDRFEFHTVLGVLERVGALHHAGWSKTWKDADDIEGESVASVRATGYRLLAEGGLGDTLDAVYREFKPQDGVEPNLTTAYGWFYHWYNLKGGMRFSPEITEVLYAHASTRFRIDRKAMRDKAVAVSAQTMAAIDAFDASFMILSQAARFCGQHLLKVRRMAVAYDLVREEKMTGRVVRLRTPDVHLLKILLERIVDRKGVSTMLGADARTVEMFENVGLLIPVLGGRPDGSKRFAYLADDVTDLLATFEAHAVDVGSMRGRPLVSVSSGRLRPKLGAVVEAIREGTTELVRIGDPAVLGLRAYAVALQDVEDLPAIGVAQVRKPDFEHWRRRIAEITLSGGGCLPPAHPAAGRGWSPQATMMARRAERLETR